VEELENLSLPKKNLIEKHWGGSIIQKSADNERLKGGGNIARREGKKEERKKSSSSTVD